MTPHMKMFLACIVLPLGLLALFIASSANASDHIPSGGRVLDGGYCKFKDEQGHMRDAYCVRLEKEGSQYLLVQDDCGLVSAWKVVLPPVNGLLTDHQLQLLWQRKGGCVLWRA